MIEQKIKSRKFPEPIFYPSVSSVAKNVWSVIDHIELLVSIDYPQFLVSCFDIYANQKDQRIFSALDRAKDQYQTVLWDSGIYEVVWSRSNKWSKKQYIDTLKRNNFSEAFSFDDYCLKQKEKTPSSLAQSILKDIKDVGKTNISPIIHCKNPYDYPLTCFEVSQLCKPKLIAIPERELGEGVIEIARNIKAIRNQLNKLDNYQLLHILGTGNPISIMLYAFAGANSFDGLDWCQTVVDFKNGTLHHPLHLDFYKHQSAWGNNKDISFLSRCYLHNLEFYTYWMDILRKILVENHVEKMMKNYLSSVFFDQVAPIILDAKIQMRYHMKLWQIDKAVHSLCEEVEKIVHPVDFLEMNEAQLMKELLICILGSGVRYEVSVAYASNILKLKILNKKNILNGDIKIAIKNLLLSQVRSITGNSLYKRYRYPERGAKFISQSLLNLYTKYGSLKNFLNLDCNRRELRRELISVCPGVGPKQASHFLKNVGYTDKFAIIDRHIIKYMELAGVHCIKNKIGSIDKYEEIENKFISLVNKFQFSISVVDQAMWFVMRILSKEALA